MKPLISIIIPVYNVDKYLVRALTSIVNQTLQNIEILCVDDCSTDNSLKILEDFSKKDTRIKIFKHDKNLGVSCTRNTALKHAKADYLMFLDPDDYVVSKFCEKMYETITKNDLDLVVCGVNVEIASDMTYNRGYSNEKNYANINTNWVWNKIFKKDLIIKHDIKFPEGLLGEDAYFCNCYKLVSNDNFSTINEKLYTYYVRKDSLMSAIDTPDNNVMLDCFKIGDLTYNFFKKHNSLNRVYISFFRSINYGINHFTEKNYNMLANEIHKLLLNKPEIKIGTNCFVANNTEFTINRDVFDRVKLLFNIN